MGDKQIVARSSGPAALLAKSDLVDCEELGVCVNCDYCCGCG